MTVEQLRELLAEFPSYYHVKVQVTVDDGWNHWDAKGNPPHTEPHHGPRFPAKAEHQCRRHPGEYAESCRSCAVDEITAETDPVLDADRSAGQRLHAQIRARREANEHRPTTTEEIP